MLNLLRSVISSLKKRDEGPSSPYAFAGLALIVCGIGLTAPTFRDALLSYINRALNTGLSLDAPWWIGPPIIALGFSLLIMSFIESRADSHKCQFVAIRHQSFQPLTGTLPVEALPKRMRRRKVQHYQCDQSNFLSGGNVDPEGAVRQQERLATHISGVRLSDPDTAFGYYGIVHIPLQFLAGCSVSTYPEVALFELNRNDNKWYELQRDHGPDLKPSLTRTLDPQQPSAVVIRISVSYPVSAIEPSKIIAGPYREYELSVSRPGVDKVSHYQHVNDMCRLFRESLDEIHNQLDSRLHVHIFYAGPVSLGFSLGRQISRTIHNRVLVYNYTSQTSPAYRWGIDVTRDNPPQAMVVRTTLLGP